MNSTFYWKPFLFCLLLMVVAILITVPLMFIGYGANIPGSIQILFPYACLAQLLGFYTGSLILLNPMITSLFALLQYPIYGYILGRTIDSKAFRKRIWIIVGLHILGAVISFFGAVLFFNTRPIFS